MFVQGMSGDPCGSGFLLVAGLVNDPWTWAPNAGRRGTCNLRLEHGNEKSTVLKEDRRSMRRSLNERIDNAMAGRIVYSGRISMALIEG